MDYMYKTNDMGSPHTADTSPEIDGTPIAGLYRGWGPSSAGDGRGGGGGALRVVNGTGSDRQSTLSGYMGPNGRESMLSELESPTALARARAGMSPGGREPAIAEMPYELAGDQQGRAGGR